VIFFLVAGYVTPIIARIFRSLIIQLFILSHFSHLCFSLYFVKWNMSEDAQDRVKLDVRYVDVKKRVRFFVNPTDKLDELKAKPDDFFIHIGSNHRTCDVIVNVWGLDLGEDKEEDFWKTMYYPQLLKDDSDVDYMFRLMLENNTLYLFVRSVEV